MPGLRSTRVKRRQLGSSSTASLTTSIMRVLDPSARSSMAILLTLPELVSLRPGALPRFSAAGTRLTLDDCPPQKFDPPLSDVLLQRILIMQPRSTWFMISEPTQHLRSPPLNQFAQVGSAYLFVAHL